MESSADLRCTYEPRAFMIRTCAIWAILLAAGGARGEGPLDSTRTAIEKGLRRIGQGAASYTTHRECFSCHHQAMALLSFSPPPPHAFDLEQAHFQTHVHF